VRLWGGKKETALAFFSLPAARGEPGLPSLASEKKKEDASATTMLPSYPGQRGVGAENVYFRVREQMGRRKKEEPNADLLCAIYISLFRERGGKRN